MIMAALAAGTLISALAFAGVRSLTKSASGKGISEEQSVDIAGRKPGDGLASADEQAAGTQPDKNVVFPEGSVAGSVDLSGLTPEQAKKRLQESFSWDLTVSDGEDQAKVPDYLAGWLADVSGKLQNGILPEADQMQPDYGAVGERLQAFAAELAGQWDKQPVNSQAESYDRQTGVYTYSDGQNGRTLDQEALAANLLKAVEGGNLKQVIPAEFTEQEPEFTKQKAKEQYRVIGTFSTKTTDNKNRNQNIKLAVEAIDGTVLKPGQEFSFNMATGNRTSEKGYQPAGAYKNGVLIEEPGGGVCQVSTTLYHAIIQSGFRTTERNAHSFAPSYVEKGQDAMVSFDGYAGPDLKFVNTGKASVVLRASFSGRDLKMSVVGLPILDEGVTVSIRSEKVRDVEPSAVYEENPTLSYGTEKTVEAPSAGSVWKSYRVLKKNGEVIEEKPLHNSSYKAKNGVIQRNTTVQNQAAPEEGSKTEPQEGTDTGGQSVTGTDGQITDGTVGQAVDGSAGQPGAGAENQAGTGGQTGSVSQPGANGQAGTGGQPGAVSQPGAVDQPGTGSQSGANSQPGPSQGPASSGGSQDAILIAPYEAAGQNAAQ